MPKLGEKLRLFWYYVAAIKYIYFALNRSLPEIIQNTKPKPHAIANLGQEINFEKLF